MGFRQGENCRHSVRALGNQRFQNKSRSRSSVRLAWQEFLCRDGNSLHRARRPRGPLAGGGAGSQNQSSRPQVTRPGGPIRMRHPPRGDIHMRAIDTGFSTKLGQNGGSRHERRLDRNRASRRAMTDAASDERNLSAARRARSASESTQSPSAWKARRRASPGRKRVPRAAEI